MKGKLYSSKNIEISYLDANLSSSDIYNPTTLKNSFELKIKQENSPLQIQGKWKNYILFRRDFENIGFIALRGKEGKSDSLFVMGLESIDPEILITFGAGDIDRFIEPIKKLLKRKYNV